MFVLPFGGKKADLVPHRVFSPQKGPQSPQRKLWRYLLGTYMYHMYVVIYCSFISPACIFIFYILLFLGDIS